MTGLPPTLRRGSVLAAGAALGGAAWLPSPGFAQARRCSGVARNVSTFSAAWPKPLQQWLPEFEAATGAQVNHDAPSASRGPPKRCSPARRASTSCRPPARLSLTPPTTC
jgi:hypothetical protein